MQSYVPSTLLVLGTQTRRYGYHCARLSPGTSHSPGLPVTCLLCMLPSCFESGLVTFWFQVLPLVACAQIQENTFLVVLGDFWVFLFCFVLAESQGMWDLSSPRRDRTHAPCSGSDTREVPRIHF